MQAPSCEALTDFKSVPSGSGFGKNAFTFIAGFTKYLNWSGIFSPAPPSFHLYKGEESNASDPFHETFEGSLFIGRIWWSMTLTSVTPAVRVISHIMSDKVIRRLLPSSLIRAKGHISEDIIQTILSVTVEAVPVALELCSTFVGFVELKLFLQAS